MNNNQQPLVGIALMVLSTVSLAALDTSGKWIMAMGLPLFVMSWVRYIVHLIIVSALIIPTYGFTVVKTQRLKAQIMRGLAMLLSSLSFFTALHFLPQADATAINFLAPLIVLAIAPWILKEPPKISRWVAALTAFGGVLLIIRPSAGLDPVGVFFGLVTALLFAVQYIITRRLANESSFTTLIWSGIVGFVSLSLLMPFILGQTLPLLTSFGWFEWLVMFCTGIFGTLGHLMQIQAYRKAPASLLSPFVYSKIISAALFGWLVWKQLPGLLSWLGIIIICVSGITITLVEMHQDNRQKSLQKTKKVTKSPT
ncbi:MAG TPA: DMT family transporter [Paenalcaligenes sp.]|nr:DMT family transporter [Paenalcaligenes sp.]